MTDNILTNVQALNDAMIRSVNTRREKDIIKFFLLAGKKIFANDYGYSYLLNEQGEFNLAGTIGKVPYHPKPPRRTGTMAKTLKRGIPELIPDVEKVKTVRSDAKGNMKSCIVIPLISEKGRFGVIVFAYKNKANFQDDHKIMAAFLGNTCGTALTTYRLNRTLVQYKLTLDKTADLIFMADGDSLKITYANSQAQHYTGKNADQLKQEYIYTIKGSSEQKFRKRLEQTNQSQNNVIFYESAIINKSGRKIPMEILLQQMRDWDGKMQIMIMMRNINERKIAERKIAKAAHYDYLTNLPNRAHFGEKLDKILASSKKKSSAFSLLFFDLDRFKFVNDILGHSAGDELLKQVSKRLRQHLKHADFLARLGGDEFVVLLKDVSNNSKLKKISQRILETFKEPFKLSGQDVYVNTSIGSSTYPEDGTDAQTLLKRADLALYRAKDEGRGTYQPYVTNLANSLTQLSMDRELRQSIKNNRLHLFYQPQLNIKTGQIQGLEGLVRWDHPELGLITPGQFIDLAEETGLITEIDNWVISRALQDSKELGKIYKKILPISINLSVRDIIQSGLTENINKTLKKYRLTSNSLKLELTETSVMHRPDLIGTIIQNLQRYGIYTYIDDFGSGYTSIKYLKQLPVKGVKIDKAFINGIGNSLQDEAIIKALLSLCEQIGLETVGEGIEKKSQLDFLKKYNCNLAQGNYICEPLSFVALIKWLKKEYNSENIKK